MADEIVNFAIAMVVGIVFIVPLLIFVAFYKKLPIPLWKKYRLMIYALPDGMEYDRNEHPLTQIAKKEGYVRKEFVFWKLTEKGAPIYWASRGFIPGFWMDYKRMVGIRNFAGQATLRVLEKRKDVWEDKNFIMIDLPEGMDPNKFEADLSAGAHEANQAMRTEMNRAQSENWWVQFALPALGILSIIILIFFGNLHNESIAKIHGQTYGTAAAALQKATEANYYATCAQIKRQYGIDCEELMKPKNETAAPPADNPIPFTQT